MSLTRVLISGALHQDAVQKLRENPELSVIFQPDCSRKTLEELVAQVLVTRSETRIDQELMDLAPDLKIIARAAVGVANIDIEYASSRGILVLNTPGKNTNSAAELTFALMLAMLRKLPAAHQKVRSGGWDRHMFSGRELRGKRLGLVGLGHVGHRVAKFALGFDMEVRAYDPYIAATKFARCGVTHVSSLSALAEASDILSVHVPLNQETRAMIDLSLLEKLPAGSWVINAARGGVIDEKALLHCLETEHLQGAAIDTWENEPEPLAALVQHPRVIACPHIGASTEEAQRAIGESIVGQLNKALNGGVVDHPVNLPGIDLTENPLAKPYAILSEKLGRIAGQLNSSNPVRAVAIYRGDLAAVDHTLIRLGWMKGFLSCAVDSFISYVNAEAHFTELGLCLEDSVEPDSQDYRSKIRFVLHYDQGESLSIGGFVFDASCLRLSVINGFHFELEPEGIFILLENEDKLGVVGDVGGLLASEGINIDSFDLSRKSRGGAAMALIRVDQELNHDALEKMASLRHVTAVRQFSF